MTRNLSREAHLWYTITSPEYMDRARDHLQAACDRFIASAKRHAFIADYAPVPYWGGKMEYLLQTYANARAMLVQGNFSEMIAFGGGLEDIPRGLQEGNSAWMGDDVNPFWDSLDAAYSICSNFGFAVTMSIRYSSDDYKTGTADLHYENPVDAGIVGNSILLYENTAYPTRPTEIPEYAADKSVSCKTGQIVPWMGVWVPADGMGKAALVFARQGLQIMQPAYHLIREDEDTGEEEYELVDCIFHPVRPTGRTVPLPAASVPAGQACPEAGFWFTPAQTDSRRYFKAGEIMPAVKSDWGVVHWQWDEDQAAPTL